jgi:lipoprotein signal peptidase
MAAFAIVFIADQASKWYIVQVLGMAKGENIDLFPTLSLTYTTNPGITFGLLQGNGTWHYLLLASVALVVIGLLLAWLWRASTWVSAIALGAAAGGAIGNVADRLYYGEVIDFIRFHIGGWSWYIFNAGDAAIVCAVIAMIAEGLLARPAPERAGP